MTVAPELHPETTPQPPLAVVPPAATPQAVAPPRIVPNRRLLTKRFPSLGFTVAGGPFWEVLLFTDRSLADPKNAGRRTPATFYSSRQDGGLRRAGSGGDLFLVPSAVLRGFAAATPKPTAIYYTAVAYADPSGTAPAYAQPPELLATAAPSVAVAPDFTADAVDQVLGVRSGRLQVVAQAAALDAVAAPATQAPAPASAPAEPAPVPAPAAEPAPDEDAAGGEDGYAFLAAHPDRVEAGPQDGDLVARRDDAPAAAPAPAPAATHDQPYDDGYGEYDDGWGAEEGWSGAQAASFPAGFAEPAPLVDDDATAAWEPVAAEAAELPGVAEHHPYHALDDAPPAEAPAAATPPASVVAHPLRLSIDDKRAIVERIAGEESGADRYAAINADGEYGGRFGPEHPAYHHHHVGLSYGIVQFTQESGNLGRLLTMMRDRDPQQFAQIFGEHADELVAVATAVGPPAKESLDGRSARTQPVDGADLWEEPWLSRFRAAGAVVAFQAAQNELAATLFVDPMLGFAGDLGLDTDRALTIAVDRAVQMGVNGARHWLAAGAGPISTDALRQQALAALGFGDLRSFQRARSLESDNLWGPLTHAALVAALRDLGAGSPIPLPTVDQMLDALVRRAEADNVFWLDRLRRLRTATDFTDKPYAR